VPLRSTRGPFEPTLGSHASQRAADWHFFALLTVAESPPQQWVPRCTHEFDQEPCAA